MSKTNGSTKENTKRIYIYSLKCNKNNKLYIGQTTNLNKRILQHKTNASQKLYVDICRYKPFHKSFEIKILHITDDKCKANRLEAYYISLFNTIKNGYNNLQGSLGAT